MKLSVSLNPTDAPVRLLVDVARRAEDTGFDGVYCYDHLSGVSLGGHGSHHVWVVLGAIAAATSRVSVGPLVANVTIRTAVDIAVAAASLQDLSDGRLVLGLGAGASGPTVYAAEMSMFGLPAEASARRRARLEETVAFLRGLWRGDTTFAGEWASATGVEGFAVPRPACPVVVGANGPKVAALAGRCADGVNLHAWEADLPGLAAVAREAAARARHPSFAVTVEAAMTAPWTDPASPERRALEASGVHELVLAWRSSDGVDAVTAAGRRRPGAADRAPP